MNNDSCKGYDYASIDDFNKNLTGSDSKRGSSSRKSRRHDDLAMHDDPVGLALKGGINGSTNDTIEGFDTDNDNMSIIKNQESEEEEESGESPLITPMPETNDDVQTRTTRDEIIRDFWEKYKIWLMIAFVIGGIILFMLVYILITAKPKQSSENAAVTMGPTPAEFKNQPKADVTASREFKSTSNSTKYTYPM